MVPCLARKEAEKKFGEGEEVTDAEGNRETLKIDEETKSWCKPREIKRKRSGCRSS